MMTTVNNLAGRLTTSRRTYLESVLETENIAFMRKPWQFARAKGTNLEIRMGSMKSPPTIFSAHFDVRKGSMGANNNASGCAVLLQLISETKAKLASFHDQAFLFLFLDGSESKFSGSRAFGQQHAGENFLAAYNFDLCGMGTTLVMGPSSRPFANVTTAVGSLVAKEKSLSFAAYPKFLSGDHRTFASFGIDACTIAVVPKKDLKVFAERFGKNDRSQPLPHFFKDAIRGRDKAGKIEKLALELALNFARSLVDKVAPITACGHPCVDDLKKKSKNLLTLFAEGKPKAIREAFQALGFCGTLTFILRVLPKNPDLQDTVMNWIPKLFSGKTLQEEIMALAKSGQKHDPAKLLEMKSEILWDKKGQFYRRQH